MKDVLVPLGLGIVVVLAGLAYWMIGHPAIGAEAPTCPEPLDKVIALVEEAGGEMLSLTDVHGVGYDQVLLASLGGSLVAGLVDHGCLVTPPMPLGGITPAAAKIGV